ncbi:MAG: type II toxin-antitoxin system RelE/ParE family toxin [Deltaproteobacteria bacterium]|nr:type II toxin-antitoxin system RelE/ParE family toxin [Deltaproteobacteria bacterium]
MKAADFLYSNIHEKFHALSDSPLIGRSRSEIGEGVRSFPIGNYVVFYRIVSEGIYISRVLHGKRDILATFESEE